MLSQQPDHEWKRSGGEWEWWTSWGQSTTLMLPVLTILGVTGDREYTLVERVCGVMASLIWGLRMLMSAWVSGRIIAAIYNYCGIIAVASWQNLHLIILNLSTFGPPSWWLAGRPLTCNGGCMALALVSGHKGRDFWCWKGVLVCCSWSVVANQGGGWLRAGVLV